MKKTISIILRLVLAALGIGYIVFTLSWHDQVILPVGFTLPDGTVTQSESTFPVISQQDDDQLTLQAADDSQQFTITIPKDSVAVDQPRLKPGIVTTLRGANVKLLLLGMALILPVFPIQAARWWLLMRCRGMHVPFSRAMRLTMVGLFYNFCMPGMTGGDVVKAYYAAKGSGMRGVAVMSVIFDRATGLMGLIMLAGIAGLLMLWRGELDADTFALVRDVTVWIWAGFVCAAAGVLLYLSNHVRRVIRLDKLLSRLGPDHFLVKIDDAASAYRRHPGTIIAASLISMPVHLCQAMATTLAGWALGMGLAAGLMLTVLPVVFLAGSVPLSPPQGVGVMDYLVVKMLLPSSLADANQLVSMLIVMRLFLIGYALIGALTMLRGDIHLFPQTDDDSASEQKPDSA